MSLRPFHKSFFTFGFKTWHGIQQSMVYKNNNIHSFISLGPEKGLGCRRVRGRVHSPCKRGYAVLQICIQLRISVTTHSHLTLLIFVLHLTGCITVCKLCCCWLMLLKMIVFSWQWIYDWKPSKLMKYMKILFSLAHEFFVSSKLTVNEFFVCFSC